MYAVIASGGKQYRVEEGATLRVEKIDAEVGARVEFTDVLLVGGGDQVRVGQPRLDGAKVVGEIVESGRGEKIFVFKYQRRKNHRRRRGHRQAYTTVKITNITA
jgi:large subunit ribosomal protein L21